MPPGAGKVKNSHRRCGITLELPPHLARDRHTVQIIAEPAVQTNRGVELACHATRTVGIQDLQIVDPRLTSPKFPRTDVSRLCGVGSFKML